MFNYRSFPYLLVSLGLLLSGTLTCSIAMAAGVCVSNPAELYAALTLAGTQNQSYTIKVVQGTYTMPGDLWFSFTNPLTVEGGYTQSCALRVVDPANTVIDIGVDHKLTWTQNAGSPIAAINIEGVTFSDTNQSVFISAGILNPISNDEGEVQLKQVRFTQINQNTDDGLAAINIWAHNAPLRLENVLVDHVGATGTCGVLLASWGHAPVSISHLTADLTGDDDFCLFDNGSAAVFSISNSVLWSSGGPSDLPIFSGDLDAQSSVNLINDVFPGDLTGASTTIQSQINADPKWVNPTTGDYHLQNNSPAINSGALVVNGGEPATDIEGHTRVIGTAPDRGAYESLVSDLSTLFVENTLDSGAGSLRDAIMSANVSATPKLIKFDIRNANDVPLCPAVIALSSTLPLITGKMTIDGYTQSGSAPNTLTNAFNAKLCVILKPASGSLNYAFWIPADSSGSLKLHGLGIGGFGQPVHILSGEDTQISGNQFGGIAQGVALPGAGLTAIYFGPGATGDILVGGNAPADRNVIGGAAQSGIYTDLDATNGSVNCQIVNNVVGLQPGGSVALPNAFGITNYGTGCQIVGNRIAGNTITNLWIQGHDNIVQQNAIGFNYLGDGFLTTTTGILVTGSNNTIGAGSNGGSITANTVRYNIAGGIVVNGTSNSGNAINANRIYDNGASSNGMDIDLLPTSGVAGPTPNDDGDGDVGPNGLQNFPVPNGLAYTGSGSIDRPATVSAMLNTLPGTYRIDVYFSNAANLPSKRGHAEVILTHATVQVPANGKLSFSVPINVPNQSVAGVISMTATNSANSTSEVSTALSTDTIFVDGMD